MDRYPTPDDPADAPVWENYVIAQASQAALRRLPARTLAAGVRIDRDRVELVFQLEGAAEADREDMADIADGLGSLLGDVAEVRVAEELRERCLLSPHDGVWWFFAVR